MLTKGDEETWRPALAPSVVRAADGVGTVAAGAMLTAHAEAVGVLQTPKHALARTEGLQRKGHGAKSLEVASLTAAHPYV